MDEHEGLGGSYMIGEDGKRVLVERTEDRKPEPPAPAMPAAEKRTKTPVVKD